MTILKDFLSTKHVGDVLVLEHDLNLKGKQYRSVKILKMSKQFVECEYLDDAKNVDYTDKGQTERFSTTTGFAKGWNWGNRLIPVEVESISGVENHFEDINSLKIASFKLLTELPKHYLTHEQLRAINKIINPES